LVNVPHLGADTVHALDITRFSSVEDHAWPPVVELGELVRRFAAPFMVQASVEFIEMAKATGGAYRGVVLNPMEGENRLS
jgi:hypothetical protein